MSWLLMYYSIKTISKWIADESQKPKKLFCFNYIILSCYTKQFILNYKHYFIMKFPSRPDVQHLSAFSHSSDNVYEDICYFYKKCVVKAYSFWWLILLLHQIILYVSKIIFEKEYTSLSWNLQITVKMNSYSILLTEKPQKYQRYHQLKLINNNFLQMKNNCLSIKKDW